MNLLHQASYAYPKRWVQPTSSECLPCARHLIFDNYPLRDSLRYVDHEHLRPHTWEMIELEYNKKILKKCDTQSYLSLFQFHTTISRVCKESYLKLERQQLLNHDTKLQ